MNVSQPVTYRVESTSSSGAPLILLIGKHEQRRPLPPRWSPASPHTDRNHCPLLRPSRTFLQVECDIDKQDVPTAMVEG